MRANGWKNKRRCWWKFNISTITAIVVSACDVSVAKHGNKAVSSLTGSADVLTELGININLEPKKIIELLRWKK